MERDGTTRRDLTTGKDSTSGNIAPFVRRSKSSSSSGGAPILLPNRIRRFVRTNGHAEAEHGKVVDARRDHRGRLLTTDPDRDLIKKISPSRRSGGRPSTTTALKSRQRTWTGSV